MAYSKSMPLMPASRSRAAWRCARAGCAPLRPPGSTGRFVRTAAPCRPPAASARNVCLTMRSSSEVERDHGEPRAGQQPARRRRRETPRALELAVDPDPQRLKRARRRIDPLMTAPGSRAARSARADRWSRRARRAAADDGARDPPRVAAPRRTRRSRRPAPPRRPAIRSRRSVPRDRSIRMSSGSSRRKLKPRPLVELHRRHAEIGQRCRRRRRSSRVQHVRQLAIVGVHQLDAVAEPASARRRSSASASRSSPSTRPRRPRAARRCGRRADRAIDEQPAARAGSSSARLGDEHRLMQRLQIPNSASAARRRR